jgi:uncharacterized protein (DUF1778 family)
VVLLRVSEAEHEALTAAAAASGLTVAGFAAEAALAAARRSVTTPPGLREALAELLAARTQVRRYGVLVDQAVAAWHAVGEPPGWLSRAVAGAERATARVDEAVAELRRRLP